MQLRISYIIFQHFKNDLAQKIICVLAQYRDLFGGLSKPTLLNLVCRACSCHDSALAVKVILIVKQMGAPAPPANRVLSV